MNRLTVNVEAPLIGEKYEFQIDENSYICDLISDFCEMICRKNQCVFLGDEEKLMLWDMRSLTPLKKDRTAADCGLQNGMNLMLA